MATSTSTTGDELSLEELRQRLDGLARLVDVTRVLAAKVDLNTILETVTHEVCQALDCDRASLYRYDPRTNELYTSVVTELEIAEIRNPLDHGITGHVARHRAIANVPDPALDPRWNSSVDRATGYQTRSILAAPLTSTHDGSLLGVLQLLNKQDGPFGKHDEELLQAFSQHAAAALDRARLVEEIRRRDAVQVSLDVARDVQRSFMPSRLPAVPGYEVATWWFPNEAVGGDYCDVLPLLDGRTGLVIADVSGHGLGPSLIMATARAALRALTLEHSAAETLLGLLGRSLADDLRDGRFITMVLAALDPATHVVRYANAGHAPALHYSAAEQRFTVLEATGFPLGVLDRPEYPAGPALRMASSDILFLCTDGIVEAVNQEDEQFGQGRLEEIVRANAAIPLTEMVKKVGAAVEGHYVGDTPPDDLTIIAARRNNH
jgi:sigma-B regulation protein RsbU (phosphoserine phosphatase)